MEELISQTKQKMQKASEHLREELASVRSGRAAPSLIEQVKVEAYGSIMVLRDLASINSPEPRLLIVSPWDANNTPAITKGIRDAGLSLNPVEEGGVIRVPVPTLTEERRKELIKLVHEKSEATRVAVRSVRREAMDHIDKEEKKGNISEDEKHRHHEQVQKVTDEVSGEVDKIAKSKEDELLQI